MTITQPLPFVNMADVEAKPIDWLWRPYIPKGAATMIIGDGGYGKSFMCAALAADLSAGRALPGQPALPPQRILMLSAEDDMAYVMHPRLSCLGARMENISVLNEAFTVSTKKVEGIMASADQFDATILFLDPLVVYMGGEVDMFKANEVRSITSKLNEMARVKHMAVVIVHHVKKGPATGQQKALGSVDMVNGTRSTLLTDVSEAGQYYMAHVKSNWAQKGPTLAYTFTNDRFEWQGEYDSWGIAMTTKPRGRAKGFLTALLKDGPVGAVEIMERGKDEGFTEKTLQRAKHGVCHSIVKDRKWYWELDEGVEGTPRSAEPEATLKGYGDTVPEVKIKTPAPDPTVQAILDNWKTDGSRS